MMIWLYHGFRLTLGAVFLFAALMKTLDIESFALTVSQLFGLASSEFALGLTIALISLEVLLGILFLLNRWIRQTAVVTTALLVGFIGVQFWLMQSGGKCHCFGSLSGASASADMVRNFVLIGFCTILCRSAEIKTPKGGEPFGA
jgi:uncharacterized membrane protein YphA (DoxX/SURF4 family)